MRRILVATAATALFLTPMTAALAGNGNGKGGGGTKPTTTTTTVVGTEPTTLTVTPRAYLAVTPCILNSCFNFYSTAVATLQESRTNQPVGGRLVHFDGLRCSAYTNAAGVASCVFHGTVFQGLAMSASFAGDAVYAPSSDTAP